MDGVCTKNCTLNIVLNVELPFQKCTAVNLIIQIENNWIKPNTEIPNTVTNSIVLLNISFDSLMMPTKWWELRMILQNKSETQIQNNLW